MPFLDHLEELRWRLIKAIIAVVLCAIGVYFFSDKVLALLIRPYNEAAAQLNKPNIQRLIFLTPTGGFMIRIKLSVFTGILISLPIIFYQFWQFIVPGLLNKERTYMPIVVFFSTMCFFVGALFCYFIVLRYGLRFLLGFETADLVATISINEYLQFVTMLLLVFGLIFELPMLSFFFNQNRFAYTRFFAPLSPSRNSYYGNISGPHYTTRCFYSIIISWTSHYSL